VFFFRGRRFQHRSTTTTQPPSTCCYSTKYTLALLQRVGRGLYGRNDAIALRFRDVGSASGVDGSACRWGQIPAIVDVAAHTLGQVQSNCCASRRLGVEAALFPKPMTSSSRHWSRSPKNRHYPMICMGRRRRRSGVIVSFLQLQAATAKRWPRLGTSSFKPGRLFNRTDHSASPNAWARESRPDQSAANRPWLP